MPTRQASMRCGTPFWPSTTQDRTSLTTMGAEVHVAGPPTMLPPALESLGVKAHRRIEPAIDGADVVMMLRIQKERMGNDLFPNDREYFRYFGLTSERLALADNDAIVMHPGPMNRGVEIAAEVADVVALTVAA